MTSGGTNKERYQGKAWSLMLGTNGNASFVDNLARAKALPKGEIQRVIETRLEKLDIPEEETLALNMAIVNNHGHAGEVIVQEILRDLKKVETLVFKLRKLLIARAGLSDQNRNWSANAACNLAASILAKRCGLWNIDVDALSDWAVGQLIHMKNFDSSLSINIEDFIRNYYFEKQGQILRVKSTQDGRSKDGSGLIETLVNPEKLPHYAVVGRYETDTKMLFLLPKPLKEYCRKMKMNPTEVKEELKNRMGAETKKVHLGKGTTINIGSVQTICMPIDCGDVADGEIAESATLESLYEPETRA